MTPNLTSLTKSFEKFALEALKPGSAFDVLMKEVAGDLDWLGGKMEDKGFRDNVRTFAKDAVAAGILVEGLAKAIGGAMAVSSAYGAWKMIGGVLMWVPAVAALGAFGATVYPQPLNADEDERARQRKFNPGGSADRSPKLPVGVFPERVPAKPGSLSDKSAITFNRVDGHEYVPLSGGAAGRKDSLSRARLEAMTLPTVAFPGHASILAAF